MTTPAVYTFYLRLTAEGGATQVLSAKTFSVLCGHGSGAGRTTFALGAYSPSSLGNVQRVAQSNGSGTTTRFRLPALTTSNTESGCAVPADVYIVNAGDTANHPSFNNPATKESSSYFAVPTDIAAQADLTFRVKVLN